MSILLLLLSFQNPKTKGLFIKERVEIMFEKGPTEIWQNQFWMSKQKIRTDPEGENLTLVYDLDLHLFYLIDHESQSYRISKVDLEKRDARLNLVGLGHFQEGILQKRPKLVESTGRRKKIENWVCEEYILNFPDQSGVSCTIWATYHPAMYKDFHRKLWYAALGTSPPGDVKHILNDILRKVHGIPIQIRTSVTMEGHNMTTISTLTDIVDYDEHEDLMAVPDGYQLVRD